MNAQDLIQGAPLVIPGPDDLRASMRVAYEACGIVVEESGGCELSIKSLDIRTAAQNRRMWAALGDISRQVDWYGTRLTADEWKDVITASIKRQKVVPGLDGGFVVIGGRTSKMSRRMFSDLIEAINAFGASKSVQWSDPQWLALIQAEMKAKPQRAVELARAA